MLDYVPSRIQIGYKHTMHIAIILVHCACCFGVIRDMEQDHCGICKIYLLWSRCRLEIIVARFQWTPNIVDNAIVPLFNSIMENLVFNAAMFFSRTEIILAIFVK